MIDHLNQRITLTLHNDPADGEPARHARLVILDFADEDAATAAAAWADDCFDLDDLLGAVIEIGRVEVTEDGQEVVYTGEQFTQRFPGQPSEARKLIERFRWVKPTTMLFEDLDPVIHVTAVA